MAGSILSTGFASGDRVVVGHWASTPIGPITDVMWATPDGTRCLYVPSDLAGEFISGVYAFDAVVVTDFSVVARPDAVQITFGDRTLAFAARRGIPIPFRRPAAFTRFIEGPIARRLMGVETYGISPTGVAEWYRADRWRPLRAASGTIGGRDLGAIRPVRPACGFGFSEPPARPSWVDVRPRLGYPAEHPHA